MLDGDVTYTQIYAGGIHTVLLRSDGKVLAVGRNNSGQCDITVLDLDVTYMQSYTMGSILCVFAVMTRL